MEAKNRVKTAKRPAKYELLERRVRGGALGQMLGVGR